MRAVKAELLNFSFDVSGMDGCTSQEACNSHIAVRFLFKFEVENCECKVRLRRSCNKNAADD